MLYNVVLPRHVTLNLISKIWYPFDNFSIFYLNKHNTYICGYNVIKTLIHIIWYPFDNFSIFVYINTTHTFVAIMLSKLLFTSLVLMGILAIALSSTHSSTTHHNLVIFMDENIDIHVNINILFCR